MRRDEGKPGRLSISTGQRAPGRDRAAVGAFGEFFNAADWLLGRKAAATPQRPAVTAVGLDESAADYTYRELDDLARQAAAALVAAGIRAEERLLLCMTDTPELLALFLGCLYIGAVPVPVSNMSTAADLAAVAPRRQGLVPRGQYRVQRSSRAGR